MSDGDRHDNRNTGQLQDERSELSRRRFLGYGAAGGALLIAGPAACGPTEDSPAGSPPDSVAGRSTGAHPDVEPFELDEITIDELREGMRSGRWTARSLTEKYLDRIETLNRNGPGLHAVIETNPDALEIADRLDRIRRDDDEVGPLHGIPILLKDNIGTHDRMTTTAGSYALEGSIPLTDSAVASRLRQAGAVLLGKANLSEWANFRSTRSSSGWSARGGQCRNPYILDRNPCGSSSGSAAAVSSNLTGAAIGTETDGSVVCPSHACGIVGIKPTVGLVSRTGIIPLSHTQDTAGPMARTVRDAALILGALTGVDRSDAITEASAGKAHGTYTGFLDPAGLSGARIGVARAYAGYHERVDGLFEDALDAMRAEGAELIDPADPGSIGEMGAPEWVVLLYEFKADLNAYLSRLGPEAPVRSLEEVIEFNERESARQMPWFGQEILLLAQEKGPLTERPYLDALATARSLAREQGIDEIMDRHQLDALVAPTGGPAWVTDLVNGDHFAGSSSEPAAIAGYPSICVPGGFVHGLPVGLSFFGRAWSEPSLRRISYAFEQATRHRRAPTFLSELDSAT
jgi:amidase